MILSYAQKTLEIATLGARGFAFTNFKCMLWLDSQGKHGILQEFNMWGSGK
jgi:hypothetical protein